jgi:hypothetical protein
MKPEDIVVVGTMINMELYLILSFLIGLISLVLGTKLGIDFIVLALYHANRIDEKSLKYLQTWECYMTLLKRYLFRNDKST